MKESTIRDFFLGDATAGLLATDAENAFERRTNSAGTVFSRLRVDTMDEPFEVSPAHLVALIETVVDGTTSLDALDAIVFCLEATDSWAWDADTPLGERVAHALFLLGTPEINYPLTPNVLRKVQHFLRTGEKSFDDRDAPRWPRPHLITEKRWDRASDG